MVRKDMERIFTSNKNMTPEQAKKEDGYKKIESWMFHMAHDLQKGTITEEEMKEIINVMYSI